MTDEELLEIDARWKACSASSRSYSKSPWKVANDLSDGFLVASLGNDGEDGKDYFVVTDGVHASELTGGAAADAEFIAHAPSDIRDLCLEIVRLRAEVERLENLPKREDGWGC